MKVAPGDKLVMVSRSRHDSGPTVREIEVDRVGRTYAYIKGRWNQRFNIETGIVGDGHGYQDERVYASEAAWREESEADALYNTLRRTLPFNRPRNVSVAAIKQAASLLGDEL